MADTTQYLDGQLAEVCGFRGDIGAAGFLALATRAAPHEVSQPAFTFRLVGNDLRCPYTDVTATVNGSVPEADHPHRVQAGIHVPQMFGNIVGTAAVAAASITQTLPGFVQAASGSILIGGAISQTLPGFAQAATGTVSGGPSYLLHDLFDDTDSVDLTAHTPNVDMVSGGWIAVNGSFSIDGNEAKPGDSGGSPARNNYVVDVGAANCIVTGRFVTGALVGLDITNGITVRAASAADWWHFDVWPDGDQFRLFQRAAGVWYERNTVAITINNSTEYTIEATINGTSLSATLDGGNILNYTSSFNQSITRHGLYANDDVSIRYREIEII